MSEKIRVLIVDDSRNTRENISNLLEFHSDVIVVGEAEGAAQGIAQALALQPDVVLMDINMPGMDGISATEALQEQAPNIAIIIMSVQKEQEYLRRAMVAGAKNYLIKPFSSDELVAAIKQVAATEERRRRLSASGQGRLDGKIVTVFSAKGGVGKTTVAVNLAVALAEHTKRSTVLVDADLQFGDAAMFLNIMPQATIADLVRDIEHLDENILRSYLTPFAPRLDVLAAPLRPEQAENVGAMYLAEILEHLKKMYDFVIVDTAPTFAEYMLNILDLSDVVLLIASMDLPTVKNMKVCLEVMASLEYPKEKLMLLLNRADSEGGINQTEVEESLGHTFDVALPSDGRTVVSSANSGIPFVIARPELPIARKVFRLAEILAYGETKPEDVEQGGVVRRLKKLFGQP